MGHIRPLIGLIILALVGCGGAPGTQADDMSTAEHERLASEHEARAQNEGEPDAQMRHERIARQHAAAAEALRNFENASCEGIAPDDRAVCPLTAYTAGVEDSTGGVSFEVAEGTSAETALAHFQCHIAFARSQGREGMDECPLFVAGVEASAAGGRVALTVEDPAALAELRRRAHGHTNMRTGGDMESGEMTAGGDTGDAAQAE